MNMFSSFALYCVLLLCYSSGCCVNGTANSKSRDDGQQTVRNGTAAAETPPLSAAERVRRLIPYVTYYMVSTSDDNDLAQFRQQQNQNPSSSTVRPPLQQAEVEPDYFGQTNDDVVAGAGQPHAGGPSKQQYHYQSQQQQQQQQQEQYYRQYPDYVYRPPPQHSNPSKYLRFPSSPKTRRPIVIATSPTPLYEVDTEQQSYVYTARPQQQYTSPRPSPVPHYEYGGFLPTAPPPEHHQQVVYYTTTAKTKKIKPKNKRPTSTTTTTTTRLPALTLPALPPPPQPPPPVVSTDKYGALNELLEGYDLGGRLSNKITADNIDSSIQTLSAVLQILQKEAEQPQYIPKVPKLKTTTHKPYHEPHDDYDDTGDVGNPGRPGVDYPIFSVIPKTNFDCKTQRYKGFFGDPDTHCQVWHYCDLNGGQASFLCPNGTIFNQVTLTCDWWFNVKCDTTAQLYVLNERLYKYIIPSKPSFPEDFEGPLVDRYLEEQFRETEKKRNPQKENNSEMMMMNTVMMLTSNTTTVEPDTVRTPYQQLLDVDTKR